MLTQDNYQMLEQQLRLRGIETDEQLGWAAAVGAVQMMIRRSDGQVWELLHCSPAGLDDGEMMRANCAMTRLLHDRIDLSGTDWAGVAAALTDPDRQLPDGRTLREYAGKKLTALRRDVRSGAETLAFRQETDGARAALIGAASLTLVWGDRWYGMPAWPRIVDVFCTAAGDPEHPHWHGTPPPERPASIADVGQLKELLLAGPDQLDGDAAAWCIRAHLPYLNTTEAG
ncbi:hypothetical protein [Modestobacter excelsi]|uniref:hypothetical protein n=1 Tax=Modestobacter excelsi TaxID=2213161 RepID=UPI00110C998F|nr:hypothetical protein [Modestobacter excelsi]